GPHMNRASTLIPLSRRALFAVPMALLLLVPRASTAQWTVTNLHPAGAAESYLYGGAVGQQSGSVLLAGQYRASLWSGTAASWTDLTPAGSTWALAFGTAAGQQVGRASVGAYEHAGLWSGAAASWVDLHPSAS